MTGRDCNFLEMESCSDNELLRRDELKSAQFYQKQPPKDIYAIKLSSGVENFEERAIFNVTVRGRIRIGPMHVLVGVIALAAVIALDFTYQYSKNREFEKQIADDTKQSKIVANELQALRLAVASLYRQEEEVVEADAVTYSEFKNASTKASRIRRSPGSRHNNSDDPRNKHVPSGRRLSEPMSMHLLPNFLHIQVHEEHHVIGPWGLENNETGQYHKQFLNMHRDEVKIKQTGLYLVYAQVEVVIIPTSPTDPNSSDEPPIFQIWVKNNLHSDGRNSTIRTIAECIPAFPHTTHQTCFTMTAAQLQEGETVSLRAPATNAANITIYTNGIARTFFGFVKLG